MKKLLLLLPCFFLSFLSHAQLNMTLQSQVQYDETLSDVWGWTNPEDGREYALVGLFDGLNIQDVTDPANPVDMGTASGAGSIWRDIKTWAGFAYITNETGGGLMVIDLRNLPTPITENDYWHWEPSLPGLGVMRDGHNIYIDEFGYAYIAGSNVNGGGVVIVDVFTNPGNPEFVVAGPPINSHDVYVRDNLMFSSEIGLGQFSIYNVLDKQNIVHLGSQQTAATTTHNAWLSDDGNTLFTTDETSDAPIGSYDVSDPGNIEELDLYWPAATLGQGVIPHNVHVWNDWVIISFYTDGCIVLDGSRPTNMVEVGNFDTWLGGSFGFNGAWGAYPFFPSQTILVSDQDNGLYVLEPNYVRACFLEGKVTDVANGFPLDNVEIIIDADEINYETTDGFGEYGTGLATSGTYNVTFTKSNYFPVTAEVVLENGEVKILDVQMESAVSNYTIAAQVVDELGNPVPQAQINLLGFEVDELLIANENGNFEITILEGNYDLFIGAWGYVNKQEFITLAEDVQPVYVLDIGYRDDFIFDYGWEVEGTAITGRWERGVPNGTNWQNTQANPNSDVPFDLGNECYVTGNGGGTANNDDVDLGNTVLISPPMDLSNYESVEIRYSRWFFNAGGNSVHDDALTISLNNGTQTLLLENIEASFPTWGIPVTIPVDPTEFELNDNVRIILETSDGGSSDHITEAAFDFFRVTGEINVAVEEFDGNLSFEVYPNPFEERLILEYDFAENFGNSFVHLYNILGQKMETAVLSTKSGTQALGEDLKSGIYFVQIESDGQLGKAVKVIKN